MAFEFWFKYYWIHVFILYYLQCYTSLYITQCDYPAHKYKSYILCSGAVLYSINNCYRIQRICMSVESSIFCLLKIIYRKNKPPIGTQYLCDECDDVLHRFGGCIPDP